MNAPLPIALIILALAGLVAAQSTTAPYDTIERLYGVHLDPTDSLAWPLKVKAISADPYKFWRGSKDLFFIWAKANCADWLADRSAYIPIHADLHFGNIGSYAVAPLGKLAFGPVDFDDAALAPFQLELLGGAITLKLVAQQNGISRSADFDRQLMSNLLSAYGRSAGARPVTSSARPVGSVVFHLFDHEDRNYAHELEEFTENDRFRATLLSSKGVLKEILRPATQRADDIAGGLAEAVSHDFSFSQRLQYKTRDEFRAAILDVALRTRLGSGGSQGLKKYLVLLRHPLVGSDSDAILYLKQAIPAAAERAGAIPRVMISPGQRLKESVDAMTDPPPLLNSWCDIGGESYWVSLKEPWSQEIDSAEIRTAADLLEAATLWGEVAGAAHRRSEASAHLSTRLEGLAATLHSRSENYLAQLNTDYANFRSDPRVKQESLAADAALATFGPTR